MDWIRVEIIFNCPTIIEDIYSTFASINALSIITPSILKEFSVISKHCIFVSDGTTRHHVTSVGGNHSFSFTKDISIVFSQSVLQDNHSEIGRAFEELLLTLDNECDLIKGDNLAQGKLVGSVRLWGSLKKTEQGSYWSFNTDDAKHPISEGDPVEYWGPMFAWTDDFVAGAPRYPWSPVEVGEDDEIPF